MLILIEIENWWIKLSIALIFKPGEVSESPKKLPKKASLLAPNHGYD